MRRNRKIATDHSAANPANHGAFAGISLPRDGSALQVEHIQRQLADVRQLLPLLAGFSVIAVASWIWLVWSSIDYKMGAWLASSVLATVLILHQCLRNGRTSADIIEAARGLAFCGAFAAFVWGTLPLISSHPLASALSMSMFALAVLALAASPLSAIAFISAYAITLLIRFEGFVSAAVIMFTLVAAFLFALTGRRQFIERISAAAGLIDHQRAMRLSATFESCGNGWFWETNTKGQLTYVSSTFGTALGMNHAKLTGRPLVSLIAADVASQDSSASDARSLSFHLQAQLPFHEVTIPVRFPTGVHWWSLSESPCFNKNGIFSGFSGIGTDLTDVRQSEDRAAQLARFDPLTGLANRATIRETLEASLTRPANPHAGCTLLLLDLDRFKTVNDTLGHLIGDKLLELVASRLSTLVSTGGRVGRLGGDEFAVVVHDTDTVRAPSSLAVRIIDYLSAAYTVEGHRIVIGASIGIAIAPDHGQSVDSLMRNADLALYAAKADGRGKHRIYEGGMHRNAEARRQIENDLRAAIVDDTLSVHFQPLVDTNSEMLVGFEALARWHHPKFGEISPSRFIPIAEEAGLIEQIGEWVLRTACKCAAEWPEDITVAVNLSPLQFANPELTTIVMNALAQSGLAAERLELEVTESIFLKECATTRATLQRLNAIGIKLTLDDFGTGYSSLGYLNRAPFRKIKIDRSFVSGASAIDGQKAAIIKAIVALAESLGMATTAEGAETHEDLLVLRRLGCTQVQGFLFGKAMVAADAAILARLGTPIEPSGNAAAREQRVLMLRGAKVHYRGEALSARLRNSSPTGAMFEATWRPEVGERLYVTMAGAAERSGVVRWVQADNFGILFDPVTVAREQPARRRRSARA